MDIKKLIAKKLKVDENAYGLVEKKSDKIYNYVYDIESEIIFLEKKLKKLKDLYQLYSGFNELNIETHRQLGDEIYKYALNLYKKDKNNKDIYWLLEDSVKEGSIIGKFSYAKALIYGDLGIKTSYQEGLDMLYELAQDNYAEAYYEFVIINEKMPHIVESQYAYEMCIKAKELGYSKAIERLNHPFDLRTYTEKLISEAKKGKVENYYLISLRTDLHLDERIKYFELALNNNDYRALYDRALISLENNDTEEAKQYLEKAGENGCAEAYIKLGDLTLPKDGEPFYNYSKIDVTLLPLHYHIKQFDYYKLAANLNNIKGCLYTGLGYYQGYVIKQDFNEAFKYFLKAVELGDEFDAVFYLGKLYEEGKGCTKDEYSALMYYSIGADKGNINCMMSLYNIYKCGLGNIEPDIEIANKYLFMSGIGRD